MKKVLIVIVVLLSLGVIAFGIFYASTHDFNVDKEEKETENVELNKDSIEVDSKDSITLVNTEVVDESFVQTYDIMINGKERTLEV